MINIIKITYKNKLGKYLLIPLLFILVWIGLTTYYIVTFDTSFSIWSFNHSSNDIHNLNFDLFNKGETFKGEFIAQDNNLGIVSVRFQTYVRPPFDYEDHFLFKIKEKNANHWYYQNVYRSGLVYDVPFFPFGFPEIKNSKGKTYEFEITTLNTTAINQISISKRYPILQSKYKYSGKELLKNSGKMYKFLIKKFINAFRTPDVIFSSFVYLLPFLFYLTWISFLGELFSPLMIKIGKILKKIELTPLNFFVKIVKLVLLDNLDYFLIFVVFIDIFLIQLNNDIVYLVISVLLMVTLKVNKKETRELFIIGLSLLILSPLSLLFNLEPTAVKSASWAYVLLVAGVVQTFIDNWHFE